MPEPIEPINDPAEVETLRTTNAELLAKRKRDKQRIAEQEATVAAKDVEHLAAMTAKETELSQLKSELHSVKIEAPLRAMANDIANEPEWFLEQLAKHYTVTLTDGQLSLLTLEGKPVMKDGKPLPWERKALFELLTAEDHPGCKGFRSLLIATRASGAGSIGTQRRSAPAETSKPKLQFGLR